MHDAPLPLDQILRDTRLRPLADKVLSGGRLDFNEGLLLYETPDLTGLGAIAHRLRLARHGRKTFFVSSRRLSYTNVCHTRCHQLPPATSTMVLTMASRLAGTCLTMTLYSTTSLRPTRRLNFIRPTADRS